MRTRFLGTAFLFACGVIPASAQTHPNYQLATNLATMLLSEEYCGLTFDQDAITTFIAASVPADDMMFANDLSVLLRVHADDLDGRTKSQKTAHCAVVTNSATHMGFIKN